MNSQLRQLSQRAKNILISKHNCIATQCYSNLITTILRNNKTSFVSLFKDYLIYDDDNEFLKRYYKSNETQRKLLCFFEFYELNSKIFPNYVSFYESKYLFKNIKRKQKMLDNLKEIEDNHQNASQSDHSEILTSNAMGSLYLNLMGDESRSVNKLNINCDDIDNNEISVEKILNEINKYDKEEEKYEKPNGSLLKQQQAQKKLKHYSKYINENKSKNKANDKNPAQKNHSSKIKQLNKVTPATNNRYNRIKKEESKVVFVLKNDIIEDKRISSTSYHKRSGKQGKIVVVLPGKENTTSVINKKYAKKIDVSSVNEKKPIMTSQFNSKYSKSALTERNHKSVNNNNNANYHKNNPKENGANIKPLIKTSLLQISTNKIKKNESKSITKSSTKDNFNLFSPQENNLTKSSINPQLTKYKVETKSKPIIILKDNKTQCQVNHKQKEQITSLNASENVIMPNNNSRITTALNVNSNSNSNGQRNNKGNKKYTPFIRGIPNLHINFNCRRSFLSKSKENSMQKKSNLNNATNNTTHTVNESMNNKSNIINKKKQDMYKGFQQKKKNSNKENYDIRSFILNKEAMTLGGNNAVERPQTERMNLNRRPTQLNYNSKVPIINDQGKDLILMLINKKDSISRIENKLNHFKANNSSISNNNHTILNETGKGSEPLTERIEHLRPNPLSGKTNHNNKTNEINTNTKCNNNNPLSPTSNQGISKQIA